MNSKVWILLSGGGKDTLHLKEYQRWGMKDTQNIDWWTLSINHAIPTLLFNLSILILISFWTTFFINSCLKPKTKILHFLLDTWISIETNSEFFPSTIIDSFKYNFFNSLFFLDLSFHVLCIANPNPVIDLIMPTKRRISPWWVFFWCVKILISN